MMPSLNNGTNRWRKRRRIQRIFLLLGICSIIVIIALIVSLSAVHKGDSSPKRGDSNQTRICTTPGCERAGEKNQTRICTTPGCEHVASEILQNMDATVDPCQDFYKFSCGSFLLNTTIDDDQLAIDSFSLLRDNLQYQLRVILEEPIKSDEIKLFKMAKNLYKGCMNKTLTESRGTQPLLKALNSFGGWPVLVGPNWNASAFTWQKAIKDFRKKGYDISHFFDLYITNDFKYPFKKIFIVRFSKDVVNGKRNGNSDGLIQIMIDQVSFGEFPILFDTPYLNYMVDIAVLLGAPRGRAIKELKDSFWFEKNLALASSMNNNKLYNPRTIAELQAEYPSISWLEYINDLLPAGLSVTGDEVVNVVSPFYLTYLEILLKITPKRILANYVMWRITFWSVPFLPEEFRKRELEFFSAAYKITQQEPAWKECAKKVYKNFHVAVDSMYVQKYFNKDAKKLAVEMVNGIRAEFINNLENVDWMDEDTRKHALEKTQAMTTYIAYPDEILDHKKLEEYYNDLEVDENHFMESLLNIKFFNMNYKFNKLREPFNKSDWVAHPKIVKANAYNMYQENSIDIPAGILQEVFFSVDRPNYMNYGAIGYIIGHEISHGLNGIGRQFNKDDILENWWSEATKDAYVEKANCIIEQYGNYTAKEINQNVNGTITQDENIADNGGIKLAYLAYSKWVERHGEEPQLPGLKYTPKQMFWISAANAWCSKYKPEAVKFILRSDEHSPDEFRILGPLSNLEEFAKDFECPAGSPMNPHHKCKIW